MIDRGGTRGEAPDTGWEPRVAGRGGRGVAVMGAGRAGPRRPNEAGRGRPPGGAGAQGGPGVPEPRITTRTPGPPCGPRGPAWSGASAQAEADARGLGPRGGRQVRGPPGRAGVGAGADAGRASSAQQRGRVGPPWGPTGGSKRRLHAAAGRPDRGRRVGRPRWRADGSWSARAGGPSGPSQAGPSPGLGWRVCRRRPPPPWPRPTRGGTGPAVADAPAPDTARRAARGPGRGPGRTCARGATGAGRGQPQPPGQGRAPGAGRPGPGPGVQHPQAPAAPADSRRVQGTLQARWGGGTADDRGEGLRRTPAQRPHRLGRGADHVHVGDGAARRTPCGPPGRGIRALARRTPAVAAGRGRQQAPGHRAHPDTGARPGPPCARGASPRSRADGGGTEPPDRARSAPPSRRQTAANAGRSVPPARARAAMRAWLGAGPTSPVGGVRGVSRPPPCLHDRQRHPPRPALGRLGVPPGGLEASGGLRRWRPTALHVLGRAVADRGIGRGRAGKHPGRPRARPGLPDTRPGPFGPWPSAVGPPVPGRTRTRRRGGGESRDRPRGPGPEATPARVDQPPTHPRCRGLTTARRHRTARGLNPTGRCGVLRVARGRRRATGASAAARSRTGSPRGACGRGARRRSSRAARRGHRGAAPRHHPVGRGGTPPPRQGCAPTASAGRQRAPPARVGHERAPQADDAQDDTGSLRRATAGEHASALHRRAENPTAQRFRSTLD